MRDGVVDPGYRHGDCVRIGGYALKNCNRCLIGGVIHGVRNEDVAARLGAGIRIRRRNRNLVIDCRRPRQRI